MAAALVDLTLPCLRSGRAPVIGLTVLTFLAVAVVEELAFTAMVQIPAAQWRSPLWGWLAAAAAATLLHVPVALYRYGEAQGRFMLYTRVIYLGGLLLLRLLIGMLFRRTQLLLVPISAHMTSDVLMALWAYTLWP